MASVDEIQLITNSEPNWDNLGLDIVEMIFYLLPISSMIRACAVCKQWRSIITSSSFLTSTISKKPWLFLHGQGQFYYSHDDHVDTKSHTKHEIFAFDPEASEWFILPTLLALPVDTKHLCTTGSGGLLFITHPGLLFTPVFKCSWRDITPPEFSGWESSLVEVFAAHDDEMNHDMSRFVVVGGLYDDLDSDDDDGNCKAIDVWMYHPTEGSWELCSQLPAVFKNGITYPCLCSATFRGKFYVYDENFRFISAFDIENRTWSQVKTLEPPAGTVKVSYLVACSDYLVLIGFNRKPTPMVVTLWKVDEVTLELTDKIAVMPQEMWVYLGPVYLGLTHNLRFVGLGNLIYVLNLTNNGGPYAACVCEVDSPTGCCNWRGLSPSPCRSFESMQINAFCSRISLESCLFGD